MTTIFTLYSNMIHLFGGFEGMRIPGEYCKMVQFGVYFDTILHQKILEIFTYCIKIIILWPSHC